MWRICWTIAIRPHQAQKQFAYQEHSSGICEVARPLLHAGVCLGLRGTGTHGDRQFLLVGVLWTTALWTTTLPLLPHSCIRYLSDPGLPEKSQTVQTRMAKRVPC